MEERTHNNEELEKKRLRPRLLVAVNLAELALRWRNSPGFSKIAVNRIEKVLYKIRDPRIACKLHVVLWTLRRAPFVRPELIRRAHQNLGFIADHFELKGECGDDKS